MTGAWLCLIASGLIDVARAYSLKRANGFEHWRWSLLPLALTYVVWTGIGAIGSVLVGMWLFGEVLGMMRLACLALIVAGIVGLKLQS